MQSVTRLDQALLYLRRGWSVFPVHSPSMPRDGLADRDIGKKPLVKWEAYQHRLPTEPEARKWWTKWPDANIGLATGKVSRVIVIDLDSQAAIANVGLKFGDYPPLLTLCSFTHRGMQVFATQIGQWMEVKNGQKVMPGVDVRGDGGYVVLPSSAHREGSTYEWADESVPVITAPDWLMELVSNRGARNRLPHSELVTLLEGVSDGEIHNALIRLAGHWFGIGYPLNDVERLSLEWNKKNKPPAPDDHILTRVRDLGRRDTEKKGAEPTPAHGDTLLPFPESAYVGAIADFAEAYARTTESPKPFLYLSALTFLGACVANSVTLDTSLEVRPCLFTALLGPSADGRKSASAQHAEQFFRPLIERDALGPVAIHYGIGSAEGLADGLSGRSLLLYLDELKTLVDKARPEGSIVLTFVNSMFERGEFDNTTKTHRISVRGAYMSLLGCSTLETYESMWSEAFISIGFPNRLFLTVAEPTSRIPIPQTVDTTVLRESVRHILGEVSARAKAGRYRMRMSEGANAEWESCYAAMPRDVYARRLDTYGLRLMILLSLSRGEFDEISADTARRVRSLLDYEYEVRRMYDPVDAANSVAKLEELIRRTLRSRGPLTERDLRMFTNAKRYGLWAFKQALVNLQGSQEVAWDRTSHRHYLRDQSQGFRGQK
jgi:hypothetical protein